MSKLPYKPLTDINIMADAPAASVPAGTSPAATAPARADVEDVAPPPEPRRQINYRPTVSTAERLRLISFRQRRPVQELLDEAVLLWLAGQK
ncbi:hypothetical protein [Roseomonas marmotae]|uniref:Chromosome partitioning protein ParB n=1 Tax=Roseomonas marmotae TaxID=2768161 RepID=A0ABS3KJY8_9PROT|nr:hypothetical protein [Roseomonas marmotae]MBO1077285.1 hypothetical protein [Roseomonas marmotae]